MRPWRRPSAVAAMLALALTVPAATDAAHAQDSSDQERVLEVLERTKSTRSTYALYVWTRVAEPGQAPREEWGAEFHSGDLHRVETPDNRVIADCRAGTGVGLAVESGETFDGPGVARVACGINTNRVFHSAEYRGVVQTRFGPADRVRLIDDELVREYDVSRDGVLLRTVFALNGPGEPEILVAEAVDVARELPARDMFDRQSLDRSYVPDNYRRPPPTP